MMIIQAKKVTKHFGGIFAVEKCSFQIKEGKITALIGPNGSGKSTLFNMLSRLVKEDSGEIVMLKKNVKRKEDYEVARAGISRTFQEVRLFRNLTIQDHMECALSTTDESIFKSWIQKKNIDQKKIKEILSLVGLDKSMNTVVTDLSYGQRKLLDLAIAIAKPHKLLLLDEPVAGVNPVLRKKIKEIMKRLSKKKETIVVIEHDMNFVMDLADEIMVMDAGSVIAVGKPSEIQKNKNVLEAYLGD